MKLILAYLLCTSVFAVESMDMEEMALLRGRFIERRIERGELPQMMDRTIDKMIDVAEYQLQQHEAGHVAKYIRAEYESQFRGFVQAHFQMENMRMIRINAKDGIGDHPEFILSRWLESLYSRIEMVLGFQLCKMFHLTDIKVLNWGIEYVLAVPCAFGKDEYRKHFAGGLNKANQDMDGVLPVISFWLTEIICSAATFGTQAFMLCGIVSSVIEYGCEKYVAPKISDSIYDKNCGG